MKENTLDEIIDNFEIISTNLSKIKYMDKFRIYKEENNNITYIKWEAEYKGISLNHTYTYDQFEKLLSEYKDKYQYFLYLVEYIKNSYIDNSIIWNHLGDVEIKTN